MLITKEFFEGLYCAIRSKSTYDFGPQMPMSKKGILLIHPGMPYRLDGEVTLEPRDADRLKVSLSGFIHTGSTSSAKTLTPEQMRRVETPFALTCIRVRLSVIQLFISPAADTSASKLSPKTLELEFVDLAKSISLTPSSLKL